MFRYFMRRLIGMVPTLLLVSIFVFLFVHLLPGDPAMLLAGPDADAATIELVRKDLGLDKPLYEQFISFIINTCQGNFGVSMQTHIPVSQEIAARFPYTLKLAAFAMIWSVLFGMLIGIFAAVRRNKAPDRIGMLFAVSGISIPHFAFGLIAMEIFSVELGWLPTVGADSFKHYILPGITLGLSVAAVMARFTRSSFVDILKEDYIRTARAKGVLEKWVVLKHGLRNAMIPVVTMMGLQFGFLLGGSIVVESVFNWPGMGRLLIEAVDSRDYPVIQTCVMLFSFQFIVINLIVDVLYGWINPAIRFR